MNEQRPRQTAAAILAATLMMTTATAEAITLNAPSGGTFTMNLDRDALAPYFGYRLTSFRDTAASDYTNPANTGDALVSQIGTTEISAVNRVFDLTPIGSDPAGQAAQRFVKGTSSNFSIDSNTLAGVAGAKVGMTGVQGFYAPLWPPAGGGLVNGDFSVTYDASRQTDGRSGWYLANNIYFTMAVYDFRNLSLAFTDADNWQLSGDLLMSPENGGMLQGPSLNDVGGFCLGTGTYSGCGLVAAVPVPAAAWLFGSGMFAIAGSATRRRRPDQQR